MGGAIGILRRMFAPRRLVIAAILALFVLLGQPLVFLGAVWLKKYPVHPAPSAYRDCASIVQHVGRSWGADCMAMVARGEFAEIRLLGTYHEKVGWAYRSGSAHVPGSGVLELGSRLAIESGSPSWPLGEFGAGVRVAEVMRIGFPIRYAWYGATFASWDDYINFKPMTRHGLGFLRLRWMGPWSIWGSRTDVAYPTNFSFVCLLMNWVVWMPGLLIVLEFAHQQMPRVRREIHRFRAARLRGCCPGCGYSREGLPTDASCPECGRAVRWG